MYEVEESEEERSPGVVSGCEVSPTSIAVGVSSCGSEPGKNSYCSAACHGPEEFREPAMLLAPPSCCGRWTGGGKLVRAPKI